MPKKTKETNEIAKPIKSTKSTTSTSKATKSDTKKTSTKKDVTKKVKTKPEKTSTAKSSVKKSSTKKTTDKKITAKTENKKTTLKKTSTKRVLTTKSKLQKEPKVDIVEYYDLPYRYNQTIVKVLAQTPTNLFIYWDISDEDRKNYKEQYGEDFFETTKPVLVIHNTTMNYSYEIDINDFANSWYLHVHDAKCDYKIELGRRPIKQNPKIHTDYIYISISNEIESPNNRILFNDTQNKVYFRNIKTGVQTEKVVFAHTSLLKNMEKIYNISNIYDMYKAIYNNENIEEIYNVSNPSSGNPSSGSFSSKFK